MGGWVSVGGILWGAMSMGVGGQVCHTPGGTLDSWWTAGDRRTCARWWAILIQQKTLSYSWASSNAATTQVVENVAIDRIAKVMRIPLVPVHPKASWCRHRLACPGHAAVLLSSRWLCWSTGYYGCRHSRWCVQLWLKLLHPSATNSWGLLHPSVCWLLQWPTSMAADCVGCCQGWRWC